LWKRAESTRYGRLMAREIPLSVKNKILVLTAENALACGAGLRPLEKRVRWNGRPVRALHPFESGDPGTAAGHWPRRVTINGLRNRDLQALLYAEPAATKQEARRRSAAVSRKLRLLRAHGIIRNCPIPIAIWSATTAGLGSTLFFPRNATQQLTTLAA